MIPERHEFVEYAHAFKFSWRDRLLQLLHVVAIATISCGVTTYVVGILASQEMHTANAAAYQAGYREGYQAGLKATDWKTKAVSDQNFTRPLCMAWWFGSNVRERSLQ